MAIKKIVVGRSVLTTKWSPSDSAGWCFAGVVASKTNTCSIDTSDLSGLKYRDALSLIRTRMGAVQPPPLIPDNPHVWVSVLVKPEHELLVREFIASLG